MKDQPTAGAAVQAKRRPGLSEPWRAARLVRWEGRRAVVLFDGEREEREAHKVRPVKARKAKAPRKPPPPECPRHPGYTGCCRGRSDAPPVARSTEGLAGALPPLPLPLLPPLEPLRFLPSAGPRPVAKPAKPARCRVYMDWIKGFPCLNCEAPADVVGVDPHHQRLSPADLAVGRKVGDFFCVPLCRACHSAYEDKNTLPRRTEFESLELMRDAQIRFLALALEKVPAAALRAALRGRAAMPREAALAARVVSWLEAQRWDVYQEVEHRGDIADIVAVRAGLVWVIETKVTFSLAVMHQAARWAVHYRSVAVPWAKRGWDERKIAERICGDFLQVGVLYLDGPQVDPHGGYHYGSEHTVSEHVRAPLLRQNHALAVDLRERLRPDHKTYAAAGSNRGGRWTPYKQTIADVREFLKKRGARGATIKEIVESNGKGHWASPASAKTCLRRALEDFEAKSFEHREEGRVRRYYLRGAAPTETQGVPT